jgi:predicted aspartyl protease
LRSRQARHPFGRALLILVSVATPLEFHAEPTAKAPTFREFMTGQGYEAVELKRGPQRHLLAHAQLAGRKVTVLVDTGFSFTSVEDGLAKKLPQIDTNLVSVSLPAMLATGVPLVTLEGFKLGAREFNGELAQGRDWRHGNGNPLSRVFNSGDDLARADVILGANFLRATHAMIDYGLPPTLFLRGQARTASQEAEMEASFRGSGFDAMPLHFVQGACWLIVTTINDRPVPLLLDTGAFWTVLDRSLVRELGLESRAASGEIVGVEKRRTGLNSTLLDRVVLGELNYAGVPVAVADLGGWKMGGPHTPRGLLGADLLSIGRAVVDCEGNRMWLLKSTGGKVPSPKHQAPEKVPPL